MKLTVFANKRCSKQCYATPNTHATVMHRLTTTNMALYFKRVILKTILFDMVVIISPMGLAPRFHDLKVQPLGVL